MCSSANCAAALFACRWCQAAGTQPVSMVSLRRCAFARFVRRDLEGIVGKWAHGTYRTDGRATSWLKIKNSEYSQMRDRHELFAARGADTRRGRTPLRPDLVLC